MPPPPEDLTPYPGGDLVAQGIADLRDGRFTEEALLVAEAAPRLRALGLNMPEWSIETPHLALYELVEARLPRGAHTAYNALVERIVSFANTYRPDQKPL